MAARAWLGGGVCALALLTVLAAAPGSHEGRGHCLGNCMECHQLIEELPRAPMAAARSHLDASRAGVEELLAFVGAPEVCRPEELFPLSLSREFWSLAALAGGAAQLNFPGAAAAVRAGVARCSGLQEAAMRALAGALEAASSCSRRDPGPAARGSFEARCGAGAVGAAAAAASAGLLGGGDIASWRAARRRRPAASEFAAPLGNETAAILAEYTARALEALEDVGGSGGAVAEWAPAEGLLAEGLLAYRALASVALALARINRQMMEHLRLAWGLRSAVGEAQWSLPVVTFSTAVYGRHLDVLERLVLSLREGSSKPSLRMAEMGVACGAVGMHLLLRFPDLEYIGADPTITPLVWEAYRRFGSRAALHATTSEELENSLSPGEQFDLVFVDGPHTYLNVRRDIELWHPRVRPGGILAGHDFTCAHPPLLGAVLEGRLLRGGGPINVGADGVWWWRVE